MRDREALGTRMPRDRAATGASAHTEPSVATLELRRARIQALCGDAHATPRDAVRPLLALITVLVSRYAADETVRVAFTARAIAAFAHDGSRAADDGLTHITLGTDCEPALPEMVTRLADAFAQATRDDAPAQRDEAHLDAAIVCDVIELPDTASAAAVALARAECVLTVALDAESLVVTLLADPDRLSMDGAARVLRSLATLADGVIRTPEAPLARLPILSVSDFDDIVHRWNATDVPRDGDQLMHRLFDAQAARTPDAIAVRATERTLTYAELQVRVRRLGAVLAQRSEVREVLIGVCMSRSADVLTALLAILASGAGFVPLDPDLPDDRLRFMLHDTGATLVVADGSTSARLTALAGAFDVVDVGLELAEDSRSAAAESSTALIDPQPAESIAYVIYTSGSTGAPKGVQLTHRGLCNHARWFCDRVGMAAGDRMLLHASIGFDAAVAELFAPLVCGATVVVAHADAHHELRELPHIVRDEAVTVLQLVPSALRVAIGSPAFAACDTLRYLVSGGEALDAHLCQDVHALLPSLRIGNFYGPTEATVDAASFECHFPLPPGEPIPIGTPIANGRCHILDAYMAPVPVGVTGELWLGGVGLARGYLQQPALTAERFVPDPFRDGERLYRTGDLARYRADGNIEFVGRRDTQVKVRGYRIELSEVERALLHTGALSAVAVITREDSAGDMQLVAYAVSRDGTAINASAVRDQLRGTLPVWMIPTVFVTLAQLPITANGKLDHRALPLPEEAREPMGAAPALTDPIERSLQEMWIRILDVSHADADDDFFSLGGHSLKVFRLLSEIDRAHGVSLRATTLFDMPTIRTLAAHLRVVTDREVWTL